MIVFALLAFLCFAFLAPKLNLPFSVDALDLFDLITAGQPEMTKVKDALEINPATLQLFLESFIYGAKVPARV